MTRTQRVALDPGRSGEEAGKLERGLKKLVVGQDEAVQQIVSMYQTWLAGLTPEGRPVGNLLFLGPTGSGKTRMVEATAQTLTGSPRAVIKIDCGEFQHSHEIAKLIGSPPGYLGHRETSPLLSQDNLDRYHTDKVRLSFVLFDEIEKASDSLWNLLLGILDKATLTLGDNRRVDFSRAMIFMTSNLGAAEMSALAQPRLGFHRAPAATAEALEQKMAAAGTEAARRRFTPEFLNRIDKVVVFRALGEEDLRRVLEIELAGVQQRIFTDCGVPFGLTVEEDARKRLLAEGVDARYGARHLKRAIERLIVHPLSSLIASAQLEPGDWVHVESDTSTGRLVFSKDAEQVPMSVLEALAQNTVRARTGFRPGAAAQPRMQRKRAVPGEVGVFE